MNVLALVEGLWSLPSTYEATGVHHGYRQVLVVVNGQLRIPELEPLLEPYSPVFDAWLSWIDPGGFILPHRDAGPHRERWQVPIGSPVAPFRVTHWEPHEVRNVSDQPRVHLVIDRDVIVRPAASRFEVVSDPGVLLP